MFKSYMGLIETLAPKNSVLHMDCNYWVYKSFLYKYHCVFNFNCTYFYTLKYLSSLYREFLAVFWAYRVTFHLCFVNTPRFLLFVDWNVIFLPCKDWKSCPMHLYGSWTFFECLIHHSWIFIPRTRFVLGFLGFKNFCFIFCYPCQFSVPWKPNQVLILLIVVSVYLTMNNMMISFANMSLQSLTSF